MSGEKNRQALVIDDSFISRRTLKDMLEKLGFAITEAEDAQSAFTTLDEKSPENFDLIILDLVMPEMNGAEFLIKAKKQYAEKCPPVIVCSAQSDLPMIKKLVAVGIQSYLIKPVDKKHLIKKVKSIFPDIADSGD